MHEPQVVFTIGSVESFEHNLDAAQQDMGVHVDELVPVLYKAESDVTAGNELFGHQLNRT